MTQETVGSRIRAAREKKGWHQVTLAKRAGITRGHMSNIELDRQKASLDVLTRIAIVLDVSADELLGIHQGKPRPKHGLGEKQWMIWTPLRGTYRTLQVVLLGVRGPQYSMV